MLKRTLPFAIVLVLLAHPSPSAFAAAQAPGYAEIVTPSGGDALAGLISIEGTADHPAFVLYELAFSYDPNPTDTWYPLGEPVPTRAQQTTLGLWDTTDISPGIYQLRLRVHLDSGAVLEDTVGGLRVGLPALAPDSTARAVAPSPTPPPPTAVPNPTPSAAGPAPDPVGLAVGIGGLTAAAFLLILALYLPLRRGLASWAGTLRMRRVLRQDLRRRRRTGGGE